MRQDSKTNIIVLNTALKYIIPRNKIKNKHNYTQTHTKHETLIVVVKWIHCYCTVYRLSVHINARIILEGSVVHRRTRSTRKNREHNHDKLALDGTDLGRSRYSSGL